MSAITVRATAQGYYDAFREEGDVFEIKDEKAFSSRWMTKQVDPAVEEPVVDGGSLAPPPEDEQGASTKSQKAQQNAEASKKSGGKRSVI